MIYDFEIVRCGLSPEPRSRAMMIHLLEDDAGVNEALSLLFAHFNFDVVRHGSAESLIGTKPPDGNDIVFVDLNLPGASGGDAIRWLQALRHPPFIVVISGQSQAVIRSELAGMEVAAVLRKPLDQEVILGELYRIGSDAQLRTLAVHAGRRL
jgi:FixJ family two-component response regulator